MSPDCFVTHLPDRSRAGKPRIRSASVLPRYRFHEECQRLQKTLKSWGTAPGVSQTDHDEVVRWDDQRDLSTQAGHVVCLPGYRKIASAVYPKEGPVNGAPVSLPCRGHRAHEFDVAFRQYPLTVPHSILEIEVAQARPVACRRQHVPLREEVSIRVRFQHHRPDTDRVEQRTLREG